MDTSDTPKLAQFVQLKLSQPEQSMAQIAAATGLSKRWLEMMRSGDIPNPGSASLEKIAAYYGHEFQAVPIASAQQAAA